MVKLTSPICSLDAGGTLADTITTQSWKGRTYMRKRPKPSNPNSPKQVSIRAMFAFLTKVWKDLPGSVQFGWEAPAAERNILPFNAFLQTNMLRWAVFKGVSRLYPPTEAQTPSVIVPGGIVTMGKGLNVTFNVTVLNSGWCGTVHRVSGIPDPAKFENCIGVLHITGTGMISFLDTPLEPNTYIYRIKSASEDGQFSMQMAQQIGTFP